MTIYDLNEYTDKIFQKVNGFALCLLDLSVFILFQRSSFLSAYPMLIVSLKWDAICQFGVQR